MILSLTAQALNQKISKMQMSLSVKVDRKLNMKILVIEERDKE